MGTLRRTCATMPQPSELRFRVVRAVGRGIAVLDGGPRRARGMGGVGFFVLHFHNGKCHCVADGEMFPIRMRKLDSISVRETSLGKLDSWAFWRYIQFQDQSLGLWEISQNVTIVLRNLRPTQQRCHRNMHIHNERHGALLATARRDAVLYPNYFGQTCYILK